MKILVINGSPKGDGSNTMALTRAFLEGMGEAEIRRLDTAKMNIGSCKGCFCCWNKTPGRCVLRDDMASVIEGQLWADVILWSFPLYYFSVPGPLKNLIDRQLPMSLPFMAAEEGTGSGSHPARYDLSGKRHVLISTCGFYSAERNYDSVTAMFDHFLGRGNYETIFCGQGELFRVKELKGRTEEYLSCVRRAGQEFAASGITAQTRAALSQLLFPRKVFEEMADASWGIEKTTGKREEESLVFTRQMAALYNSAAFDGKVRVLEICYTDLGHTYQIELGKTGSRVVTDGSLTPTTRIDTPWEVWCSISRGEIRGDAALAKGMYRVSGDFDLMIRWDHFFGGGREEPAPRPENGIRPPLLAAMLAPWILFWAGVSIHTEIGGALALLSCLAFPLVMHRHEQTVYDRITILAVGALSGAVLLGAPVAGCMVAGYLCFGLMWLMSCLTKEPLCAAYVKYGYGGADALNNPIFLRTNQILALGWGVLYLLAAVWSFFLYRLGSSGTAIVLNNGATAAMGIFTGWFQNWYPAHVAKGNGKK